MRVLLSTIGSRGDVQPLVALALQLRALGQEVRLCVPPDFRDWIDSLGIPVTPIGPEVRKATAASPPVTPAPPSPERRRQLVEATVATQFETIAAAAQGCDIIVAATALQIAARSVAERMGIPYVFAAYCPTVLPSPHHAPPPLPPLPGQTPAPATADNRELWARDAERFNDLFGPRSTPIGRQSVWPRSATCAATSSPTGPGWPPTRRWRPGPIPRTRPCSRRAPGSCRMSVHSPPSWRRSSTPASHPSTSASAACARRKTLSQVMIQTARALGRRAIVSRGWADLSLRGQRTRLPGHRRGQPAGAVQASRRRRPPRRRGHHNRSRASRRTPGRHPPDVRPALLGTTNPPPRDRNRARARHTDRRLADERSRAGPPTRRGCPCPLHRHRGAHRRRTGRRPTLDHRQPTGPILKRAPGPRPSPQTARSHVPETPRPGEAAPPERAPDHRADRRFATSWPSSRWRSRSASRSSPSACR